jgi:hypothetical protein
LSITYEAWHKERHHGGDLRAEIPEMVVGNVMGTMASVVINVMKGGIGIDTATNKINPLVIKISTVGDELNMVVAKIRMEVDERRTGILGRTFTVSTATTMAEALMEATSSVGVAVSMVETHDPLVWRTWVAEGVGY